MIENVMTKDWNSLTKYWVVWRNVSKFCSILTLALLNEYEVIHARDNGLWFFFSSVYSTNDQQAQYIFLFYHPSLWECWWIPISPPIPQSPTLDTQAIETGDASFKGCLTSIHFTAHISLSLVWISPIYFSVVYSIPQKYIIPKS